MGGGRTLLRVYPSAVDRTPKCPVSSKLTCSVNEFDRIHWQKKKVQQGGGVGNVLLLWLGVMFCSCDDVLPMFTRVLDSLVAMNKVAAQTLHLSIREAANLLGVSVATLRNWDRQGKLKPRRHPINGYRMYDRAEIVRLKEQIEGKV